MGLRAIVVQTTPTLSAEVSVLHTLLAELDRSSAAGASVEILLLQAVDSRRPEGHQAAKAFAALGCVSVRQIEMGGLGRAGGSRRAQALKFADLVRLRLSGRGLQRLVRDFGGQVVYSAQQRWDQRLAVRLAAQAQLPRVVHLHYNVSRWLGASALAGLASADMVVAVSDYIGLDAIGWGIPADRVHTLRNPAAGLPAPARESQEQRARLRTELGLPGDALVVGMAGRLCAEKGQLELLEAMIPLIRDSQAVHLVLAGREDPPGNGVPDELTRRARLQGVAARVHLLGHRSDVPALLAAMDVFAHPSRSEPFGLAILEAMAHGLPVVAWREGGPIELVGDSQAGLLVPPMDTGGLRAAVRSLLDDADRRKAMGEAGRERVRTRFRADEAAQRFVDLLSGAAARRGSADSPVRA